MNIFLLILLSSTIGLLMLGLCQDNGASEKSFDERLANIELIISSLTTRMAALEQDVVEKLRNIESRYTSITETLQANVDQKLLDMQSKVSKVESIKGQKGEKGIDGTDGNSGRKGEKGVKGDGGQDGRKGELGPRGYKGTDGLTGRTGEKGMKGEKGFPGDTVKETQNDCFPTLNGIFRLSRTLTHVVCERGWLVIQSRKYPYLMPFNRSWEEYKWGFGQPTGDFWFGLQNIHNLMTNSIYTLRLVVTMSDGNTVKYTDYSVFRLGGEEEKYRLYVSGPSGTGGDMIRCGANHYAMMFSTFDDDNDNWVRGCHPRCNGGQNNCQQTCAGCHGGGWWYNWCHSTNFNSDWNMGGAGNGSSVEFFDCVEAHKYLRATKVLMRRAG